MPGRNRGEELPVRTPIDLVESTQPFTVNEQNYDTLAIIQKYVNERIEAQYQDFNAFVIPPQGPTSQRIAELERQIIRKQAAHDELVIIKEAIDSAVQGVDLKYKEK